MDGGKFVRIARSLMGCLALILGLTGISCAQDFNSTPRDQTKLESIASGKAVDMATLLRPIPDVPITPAMPYDNLAVVSGKIKEASGRPLPGASITITSGSGSSQSTTSDGEGRYALKVPAGNYILAVTAKGHKDFEAKNVNLTPGLSLPLSVVLETGKNAPAPVASSTAAKGTPIASATEPAVKKPRKPASLNGMVTDANGAAIPGATVSVTNTAGLGKTVTADAKGAYSITSLPPGTYDFSASAAGFKAFDAPGVRLESGMRLPMDATLEAEATKSNASPTASTSDTSSDSAAAKTKPGEQTQNSQGQSSASSQGAAPQIGVPLPEVLFSTPDLPAAPPGATAQVATQAKVVRDATSASLTGVVADLTGAVVPGATVSVTNGSGFKRTATSDSKGAYAINGIPPGTYDFSASAPGFKPFQAQALKLEAGEVQPMDASLEVGGEKQEISVEGSKVAEVETENAQVQGVVTQKEVQTLQLNGRNFTQLIALTPGVSNQTGQDEAKVGVTGSVKYSVNGGRVEYNTFEVDGSDVLNAGLNGAQSTLVVYPSLDAIQEVKVLTSNYGAQYGRTASGTVIVTTKSGGPEWHGNGYEFFRNEALNARNYFDQTKSAPKYRRNDFGFTIGGPLYIPGHYNPNKDKTFVFWSEEFRIENSPSDLQPNFNRGVPSLAERQGDFSDVCPGPTDPSNTLGSGLFLRSIWPDCPSRGPSSTLGYLAQFNNLKNNNLTDPGISFLDPNALALLGTNLIPLPNSSTGCNSPVGSCYDAVISVPTHWREELFRIDHHFTPNLQATFRYIHDSWDTVTPIPEWGYVTNSFPTVQNKLKGPGVSMVARLTQTITPSLLNEFTASYVDSHITLNNLNGPGGANYARPAGLGQPGGTCTVLGVDGGQGCPMGAIFNNGFGGKAPGLVIAGNNLEYGGNGFTVDPSYEPWDHTNPTYSYRDDLSKALGKHTLQFGGQLIFYQRNENNPAVGAATGDIQGLTTFSNINGGFMNTGNAFANFLVAFDEPQTYTPIQSYVQDSSQQRYYNRYVIGEPYVQDDWRATPRLTVNLGVRFSLFGTFHERYQRAYNWVPSAYSAQLASQVRVDPNTGQLLSVPQQSPIPLDLNNLDPRITNGLLQCGKNFVPDGCMKGHVFNPAPRIGFAWDPKGDGKTSIRSGYGMFFEHGTGQEANTGSLEGSAPLVLSVAQPFPQNYGCIGGSQTYCAVQPGAYPLNVTAIPTQAVWSYSQQWSLSVQRLLPKSMVATVAYVGSKGTHLSVERQLNQLRPLPANENPFGLHEPLVPQATLSGPGDCGGYVANGTAGTFTLLNGTVIGPQDPAYNNLIAACAGSNSPPFQTVTPNVNSVRPYPGIGQIYYLQNGADSSYNALQATIRRTRGPLTVGASYSYSHSIDDSSDRSTSTPVDSYNLRSNRASSDFDQRHLLNVSYIYNLPDLSKLIQGWTSGLSGQSTEEQSDSPSQPSSPSRLLRALSSGWQWSGIAVVQSGTPFSIINGGSGSVSVVDNAGVANGIGTGSYPDIVGDPHGPAPIGGNNPKSFGPILGNPNAFAAPRGLTFGTAGRNSFNNPRRTNFDMSILKHFTIRKSDTLELRFEAFNVFNHTQFRIFDPNIGNTGSNVISCYGGPNYTAGFSAVGGTDCLTGNAFLHPVDAHRARTIQLGAKYSF